MSPCRSTIRSHAPLPEVMDMIARSEAVYFPVVEENGTLLGVITLERLKAVLNLPEVGSFIVAQDLAEPVHFTVQPDTTLREANQLMKDRERDFVVVLDADKQVAGFLVSRQVDRVLEAEIAHRRQTATQPA